MSNSVSDDIVRFKIEVGVEEKFTYINVTKHTQHSDCHSSSKAGQLAIAEDCAAIFYHDLDFSVNMLGLCNPSSLLFEYSASTLATARRVRVDLEPLRRNLLKLL